MNDLFGREKFGKLPKALSEKGPRTHSYEVGDLAYWSPDHDVAIYYRQDGESIPSPGVIPVAKIHVGAEAFNVPGSVKVTIGDLLVRVVGAMACESKLSLSLTAVPKTPQVLRFGTLGGEFLRRL